MVATSKPNPIEESSILSELRLLRAEVQSLSKGRVIADVLNAPTIHPLTVSLDRAVGSRKPFVLRSQGLFTFDLKLSSMRATIFLGLLLDLHDRCGSSSTTADPVLRMIEIYKVLENSTAPTEQISSLIRVGLYRFEMSAIDTPFFENELASFSFDSQCHQLQISSRSKIRSLREISVSISSSDPDLLELIDKLSAISPIARARGQRSLYISSSEQGWDRLFLEYFNHRYPVKNSSLFYRPALPTYPDHLLSVIGASAATMQRKRIMLEGYNSGRIQFDETLRRATLWDMITQSNSGQLKLYPRGVTIEHVVSHLQEIAEQLRLYSSYQLALTDAVFPFIVGIVEINSSDSPEFFSMFYRAPPAYSEDTATCFVLYDPLIAESLLSRVMNLVRTHPSTTSNRAEVISEIERVVDYVRNSGPIIAA